MRILLCRFLNHLKQRRLHFLPVDDERAAENLMTAMLGVDLRKTEYLRIRQLTPQLAFHLMQVFDFLPVRYILPDSLYTQWVPVGYQP